MDNQLLHLLAVEYAGYCLSQTDKQSTDEQQLTELVAAYREALQKIPPIYAKTQPQRKVEAISLNQH
jgi:hypothetical protein